MRLKQCSRKYIKTNPNLQFSVFLEGGYVSKQSVVVRWRGVLQNNLVLWQAACKMPNLDESNRIEHHAEKNKMQKLLPIGMDRSIIAIGTMWLLNICQARYSFVVLPQPSVSIFSNHQQCLLSKRQTGPGISKHPVTECDNKVEIRPAQLQLAIFCLPCTNF